MDETDWLAQRFEENRGHLQAVAVRMLGSPTEADDAVQEAWLRLSRADPSEVENLGGWLTTVVARVSLDMLRSRRSRREEPLDRAAGGAAGAAGGADPEREAVLADSVGAALLVVLETLSPAERLAFVLHDMFAVPFEEIAPIVDRSPTATRQLASRARRRVQGQPEEATGTGPAAGPAERAAGLARRRQVVDAFLTASRQGDFDALVALLDPDVVFRADPAGVRAGAGAAEVLGATAVASTFVGRARAARPALVDGSPGAVWLQGGKPKVVFAFTVSDGLIVAIDLLADPDRLAALDVVVG